MSCELEKRPIFDTHVAPDKFEQWDAHGSRPSDTGSEDAVITWAADQSYHRQLSDQCTNLRVSQPEEAHQAGTEQQPQPELEARPVTRYSNREEATRPFTPLRQSRLSDIADRIERLQTPLKAQGRYSSSRASSESWGEAAVAASCGPSHIDQKPAPLVAQWQSNISPGDPDEDLTAEGAQAQSQRELDLSQNGTASHRSSASPPLLQARLFLASMNIQVEGWQRLMPIISPFPPQWTNRPGCVQI